MTPIDESQLSICDPAPGPDEGKIVICDPGPEPDERKIVICPPECGPDIPDLTISGTNTPTVGSSYTATGGKPPYTWSISSGSIGQLGTITNLDGCCGTGSVTVTDACGSTASMEVRFPLGQWVYQGTVYSGDGAGWSCGGYYDHSYEATHYSGSVKNLVGYCCVSTWSPYGWPCGEVQPCCTYCTLYSMDSYFDSDYFREHIWKRIVHHYTKTYTWECP